MPLLKVENLTHRYGDITALEDVTLEIPDGRVGLVGANGAGKTTLLRILLGMLHPEQGSVEVLGRPLMREPLDVRSRVGYMPEGACLPKDQTAADFVGYAAELAGLPVRAARRRASEILFLVGLHEERFRFLGDFSTGMVQRVKLAQAIVHDPELVLLDEPASGLDPEGRDDMLSLINRLGEFGISVLFSTHIIGDIEETCDWVVMLDAGKVLRAGPLDRLEDRDAISVEVIDNVEGLVGWLTERGALVTAKGQVLDVRHTDGDTFDLIRDALAATGAGVIRLGVASTSLEEAFFLPPQGSES
jgi:ABC-2 type transport system ATP-binding protein